MPPGIAALGGVAASLRGTCPGLASVPQSSAVRTDAELWQGQDAAAGRDFFPAYRPER